MNSRRKGRGLCAARYAEKLCWKRQRAAVSTSGECAKWCVRWIQREKDCVGGWNHVERVERGGSVANPSFTRAVCARSDVFQREKKGNGFYVQPDARLNHAERVEMDGPVISSFFKPVMCVRMTCERIQREKGWCAARCAVKLCRKGRISGKLLSSHQRWWWTSTVEV